MQTSGLSPISETKKALNLPLGFIGELSLAAAEIASDLAFRATQIGLFNPLGHIVQQIGQCVFDCVCDLSPGDTCPQRLTTVCRGLNG